ncbi:hypothetical protein K7X08_000422 [Anisodus acutangulus]|uniref:Uncharacterized protein n=1 Tax=Anisodus acutangulus TaxID=402998 RepID=A0A9Q1M8F0_9SOLA|nr:hypothetical protein K7X08_000422 [Anisodus acutangulus]
MLRLTSMRLQMADIYIKRLVGVVDDVLVCVGEFLLLADFVILDCVVDKDIPIILGRHFLANGRALMDSEKNKIKFRVNDEEVSFQPSKEMKLPSNYESILVIDVVDVIEDTVEFKIEEGCLGEALTAIWKTSMKVNRVLDVLRKYKRAIGWAITDIRGIPSEICEHKIYLDEDSIPNVEHKRRLNPPMQKVVKRILSSG